MNDITLNAASLQEDEREYTRGESGELDAGRARAKADGSSGSMMDTGGSGTSLAQVWTQVWGAGVGRMSLAQVWAGTATRRVIKAFHNTNAYGALLNTAMLKKTETCHLWQP